MAVDNGGKKVVEVTPPGSNGVYPRTAGAAFDPQAPLWKFAVNDMANNEGSVQRLPNGNTLICTGGVEVLEVWAAARRRIFEITSSGETVWELTNIVTTKAADMHTVILSEMQISQP